MYSFERPRPGRAQHNDAACPAVIDTSVRRVVPPLILSFLQRLRVSDPDVVTYQVVNARRIVGSAVLRNGMLTFPASWADKLCTGRTTISVAVPALGH